MAYDTALTLVQDAAVELALVSFANKPTAAFASQDANVGLLCQLLKDVGQKLVRQKQWTQLQQLYAFTTVANQPLYAQPVDYDRWIDQSAWNRSTRLPLTGPTSAAEWEYMKANLVGTVFTTLFRQLQGNVLVYPDTGTPGGYIMAYEYVSSFWVQPASTQAHVPWLPGQVYGGGTYVAHGGRVYNTTAGGTSGSYGPQGTNPTHVASDGGITDWAFVSVAGLAFPTADTDVVRLDSRLVKCGLKSTFLRTRGFDSTAADAEYETALEEASNTEPAPTLQLDRGMVGVPLITDANLPITGIGL